MIQVSPSKSLKIDDMYSFSCYMMAVQAHVSTFSFTFQSAYYWHVEGWAMCCYFIEGLHTGTSAWVSYSSLLTAKYKCIQKCTMRSNGGADCRLPL